VLDVSLTISPIRDDEDHIIGVSKIARDITERKAREQQLTYLLEREQLARAEAEQALRNRDEFLSVAAHELRTPITSFRGFTDLLMRQTFLNEMAQKATNCSAQFPSLETRVGRWRLFGQGLY
jgi:signal transduction histidine kinase